MTDIRKYTPRLISPVGGENFNGLVDIVWAAPGPANSDITYEIQYTGTCDAEQTVWSNLKKRIPQHQVAYIWTVGKEIKSNRCRLRIRARMTSTDETTDWSECTGDFSLNVFKLIPPAIVSPLPGGKYNSTIIIVLDESLITDTYNQKVRYILEYSSPKLAINWLTIVQGVTVGQSVIRWDISSLSPSDDYILRLTAKNSNTCTETIVPESDQIARSYVYDIDIQPSGAFIIDTLPPQAVLRTTNKVTSEQNQTLTLLAEDATSGIQEVQLRECNETESVKLGPPPPVVEDSCTSLTTLITAAKGKYTDLIGETVPYTPKLPWKLTDISGLKRLEGIFTDYAGNPTLDLSKVFLDLFDSDLVLTDFIIVEEILAGSGSTGQTVEVMYTSTDSGKLYKLDPLAKLVGTLTGRSISKLQQYNGVLYVFAMATVGEVYSYSSGSFTLLYSFSEEDPYIVGDSRVQGSAEYNNYLYIGLLNGQLWKFDGASFTLIHNFAQEIKALDANTEYLYIGFGSGETMTIYDGTTFHDCML